MMLKYIYYTTNQMDTVFIRYLKSTNKYIKSEFRESAEFIKVNTLLKRYDRLLDLNSLSICCLF